MKVNVLVVVILSAMMLTMRACPVPPTDPTSLPSTR